MNYLRKTHKVDFYPIADIFTQALLVMLVTNITSVPGEYKLLLIRHLMETTLRRLVITHLHKVCSTILITITMMMS